MATTNISALLLGELQALSTEARRKHPEIKEAAERVIVIMRGIKATDSAGISAELAKSDDVVSPFLLGCKSNNHKLVAASVQCLQQLVSHQAVSPRSIREALGTLNTVSHLGMDIQVKILQMVLPLVTMYDGCVFGETLVEALHLCLALQRSRDLIVNNTAAAILRQVVVAVFDRVVAEDREHADDDAIDSGQCDTTAADMSRRYAKDAYFVLQDLCLLAAGSDSIFIRVDSVDQGLVLDLIESVLTNHAAVITRHTAMVQILRERLAPFIVSFFADKAPFMLAVRCIRIVWLFIRDLHDGLAPECEVFLSIIARLIDPGAGSGAAKAAASTRRQSISAQHPVAMQTSKTITGSGFPLFYRVLAVEVARLTLQDPRLLCQLYAQYDGRGAEGGDRDDCHVVADIVAAVAKVATEQPELRASGGGGGIPQARASGLAGDGAAGLGSPQLDSVADARAGQLGAHNSSMRTEMHRLLDKHDPPSVPETYASYVALTTVAAIASGLAEQVLPLCSDNVVCGRPDPVSGSVLSPSRAAAMLAGEHAAAAGGFVAQSWPVLHSACAFFLAVRLDDALFGRTMDAVQKLAQVCAAFGLDEARNAFMLLLCRGCLPQAAIADHERQLQQSPVAQARGLSAHGHEGTSNARAENSDSGAAVAGSAAGVRALPLVTTSLVSVNFSMNARQVECLRAVVACAQYLAPVLGPTWYPILVTLQQAEEILYQSHRAQAATAASIGSAGSGGASARRGSVAGHGASSGEVPSDGAGPLSDLRLVRRDYARLFAFARVCGRDAVMWMVRAMCTLGSDLSNVPAGSQIEADDDSAMRGTASIIHRRLSAVLSRPTFAVEQLRAFAVGNIDLLVGASMDDGGDGDGDGEPVGHAAWLVIMQHLLETTAYLHVPAPIRTQACEAVADIVLAAMGLVARADVQSPETADGEDEPRISERFVELVRSGDAQVCALTPLLQMMTGRIAGHEPPKKSSTNGPADFARFVDVCRLTLDTVHKLLQALGRSIVGAWGVVFDIIRCVLDEPATPMLASTASAEAKQPGFLMRCAFPCLQLICSDYLEDLPAHCLRRCIESMALFGRQTEDLNISLTAIGQAWALCDFLQGVKDAVIDNGRSFGLVSDELAAGVGELAFRRITDEWWQEDLAGLEQPRTRQVLWILLVRSLASLGRDRRHEVRLGAIQTLFRTLEMHGESFDVWMWDGTVWSVVLPLAGYALGQRAHVFELIQQGQLDQLVSDFADPQEEKTQMANKSGVIVEDPARLYRRQWDETATTALQGTARIWAAHSSSAIWDIGFADQAWQFTWRLVQAFFVGEPRPPLHNGECPLPDAQSECVLDVPKHFVDELACTCTDGLSRGAEQLAYLRTRDSTATAIDCASVLVASKGAGGEATQGHAKAALVRWRVGWRAWLAMGALACHVPEAAEPEFNTDSQGSVVITQDVLCSYLQLCPTIVRQLRAGSWFSEDDSRALLELVRLVLMYVDAPIHSSDDTAMTKLQVLALDSVMLVLATDDAGPGGDKESQRVVDPAAASALVLSELAVLATAPYILRAASEESSGSVLAGGGSTGHSEAVDTESLSMCVAYQVLSGYAVAQRSAAVLARLVKRLDDIDRHNGGGSATMRNRPRRAVRPSFIALAVSALDRLGGVLQPDANTDSADGCLAHALLRGVWQDSIVAMGLHMVAPLTLNENRGGKPGQQGSDWFARVVPLGMLRLRDNVRAVDAERGNQARKALADAWTAVGDVLAVALGVSTKPAEGRSYCNADCGRASGLPVRVQIGLLDVVAAASIRYVSADDAADSGQRPAEVVPYWTALVQILERGAELAVEPVVLLGADNGVYGNGDLAPNVVRGADALDGTPQALTMACCKWLFAMSSQTIAVEALLAGTADGVVVATPAWVSEAAVPAMVRRSRAVVEAFVGEHALVGRSPMPLSQIRLLRLVLDGLAHLQCQPGALLQADGVGRARDSAAGRQVLGGSAAHVFAMYDSLVGLLAVPDADILRAVQQCLRRVSAELFG